MMRALPSLSALLILALSVANPAKAGSVLETLVLERAFADYGHQIPGDSRLRLEQLAPKVSDPATLAEFWMDPRTGRFLANVVRYQGQIQRIQGRLRMVVPVPVPLRRMMPGERLTAADLHLAELPVGALNGFAVMDPTELIGKEVRRILAPDRPIMTQSIMTPLAVTRGDKVTIAFREGPMRLSAPGRALADAHLGDEIRVVNLSSNKTISAIARENGIMEVLN